MKSSNAAAGRILQGGKKIIVFFLFCFVFNSQKFHPSASMAKFFLVFTVNIPVPSTTLMAHPDWFLPPQVGCCANRVHEEQGVGQVLSRAPGITQALFASGFLPAQASAEDPQVSPTVARAFICLTIYMHIKKPKKTKHIHRNARASTYAC